MSKILKNIHSDLAFTNNLINWGKSFGRKNLPWNPSYGKKIDPYKVWLSEIMLQQTQFRTGVKYFERFIKHFPNVKNLAESEIETVLSFWSGLGYYARAKNMHKAAKIICSGGKVNFPKSASDWKKLPGIGFSTAAAISAFTVNEKQPIMDANVIRIVARQHKLIERIGSAKFFTLGKCLINLSKYLTPVLN